MKKLYKLTIYAAFFIFAESTIVAQTVVESFNSPTQLFTTGGWIRQNLSTSADRNWFTGNPAVFSANSPLDTTYLAANWASTSAGGFPTPATLSNWLITPTFTLNNGDVVSFYTRTASPVDFPDRLQFRMSTAGTSTNVGTSPTTVGDFTTVAVDINPSLTTSGYPTTWTQYSYTVTGLSTQTIGRFAFRYFVTGAGTSIFAVNGSYIGIDDFSYTPACAPPTITANSGTICAGQSFTINPSGAASFSYTGGSAVVTPTTTTSYTVTGFDTPGCEGTAVSTVSVTALPTLTVNSGQICAGESFTITPSGAATFTISDGNNSVVSPTITTDYTVTGTSAEGCENSTVNTVTVNPLPIITVNSGTICAGQGFTISPSGASSYTISGGSSTIFPTTSGTYTVTGTSAEGCSGNSSAVSTVVVEVCTSIESLVANTAMSIYPNPFKNSFTIEVSGKTKFIITDVYGKAIIESTIEIGNYNVDLSNYASGIYFVELQNANSNKTVKLIKE